jgi:hypothetical protein
MPAWADAFLAAPGEEFFASRLWFDVTLAGALAPGTAPLLARCGPAEAALVPLLVERGRRRALATPYSLAWQPLFAHGADAALQEAAGGGRGAVLRRASPVTLDLVDPEAAWLAPFVSGLAASGIRAARFDHVGNWHEVLPGGTRWEAYLASRPARLRNTVRRRLARAAREFRFTLADAPGPALTAAIDAYEAVRAASWKPHEPFPGFDRALLEAAAGHRLVRLGVLRAAGNGEAVAAQYWILDRAGRRATVLKLAHAEAARAASPGTVLTALMVRHLLDEDGVGELDFGRGDDPYKADWVGTRRQRIGLVLADPLHPGGLAALARQWAGAARRRLRAWSARSRKGTVS